jgi:hypothetical protein
MSAGEACCANVSDEWEYNGSINGVPLPPPRLLVPGETDGRCCCGCGGAVRLPVLALVLDCSETGLSESRSRLEDDGLG